MRAIKFRGQRVDNGEMVYGDLIHGVGRKKDLMFILPNVINLATLGCGCDPLDGFNVIPETIGQFTGQLDCNGVEIYEGDVLNLFLPHYDDMGGETLKVTIIFKDYGWWVEGFGKMNGCYYFGSIKSEMLEVIGIHK